MVDDTLFTLNILAFSAPFVVSAYALTFLRDRNYSRWISFPTAFLVFSVILVTWFYMYRYIGFPGWMRWPTEFLERTAVIKNQNHNFVKPGYYSVNKEGWQHNTTPDGDIFTCTDCGTQVQIQISYGPELHTDFTLTNEIFLSKLNTEEKQREFVEPVIRKEIPLQSGFTISIDRVGLSEIGGLDVFQFSATVNIPPTVSHENGMVAIHKNRIMKLSLNYFDGALNQQSRRMIHDFYSTLHFF